MWKLQKRGTHWSIKAKSTCHNDLRAEHINHCIRCTAVRWWPLFWKLDSKIPYKTHCHEWRHLPMQSSTMFLCSNREILNTKIRKMAPSRPWNQKTVVCIGPTQPDYKSTHCLLKHGKQEWKRRPVIMCLQEEEHYNAIRSVRDSSAPSGWQHALSQASDKYHWAEAEAQVKVN